MAFTPPPTPPNSGDPANFNARADAFLGWFPGFVTELNAQAYPDLPALFRINGTAEAPALSWASDPDTGMFRPAENHMGWATGGVRRLLLGTTGFEIDVPVGGSAVQATSVDPSPGRLMKVGAFGLGSASAQPLANIDAFDIPAGMYWSRTETTGTRPPGATNGDAVLVLRPVSNQTTQIYSLANDGATYIRKSVSNTSWGAWRRVDTIRGSNANGEYAQFGDGTLLCWGRATTTNTDEVAATFPAAFSATPRLGCGINSSSLQSMAPRYFNLNTTGFSVSCFNPANSRVIAQVDYVAAGRWF